MPKENVFIFQFNFQGAKVPDWFSVETMKKTVGLYCPLAKFEVHDITKEYIEWMNQSQIGNLVSANISYQRDWARKQLIELGVQLPHPMDAGSPEADECIRVNEERIQMIKKLIHKKGG